MGGYLTAIGSPWSTQAYQAALYFRQVTGTEGGDPREGNAILTGHSLGGGLAGFVGAIYNREAVLFDNMVFELAALQAIESIAEATYYELPLALLPAALGGPEVDISGLHGYATTGEFLTVPRLQAIQPFRPDFINEAQNTPVEYYDSYSASFDAAGLLHSQALLASLIWADNNGHADWYAVGQELWAAMLDLPVAEAAGWGSFPGLYTAEYKMLGAISYTGFEGGVGLVFGDTALPAMFDDADELARVLATYAPSNVVNATAALLEAIVQFAGMMARQEVLQSAGNAGLTPQDGVIKFSRDGTMIAPLPAEEALADIMILDLSDAIWELQGPDGLAAPEGWEVRGVKRLLDDLFGTATDDKASVLIAGIEHLYGVPPERSLGPGNIARIHFGLDERQTLHRISDTASTLAPMDPGRPAYSLRRTG